MLRDVSAALLRVTCAADLYVRNFTDYSKNFLFCVAENEEFLSFENILAICV